MSEPYGDDECISVSGRAPERPYGWVQFKGTDLCMDVNCSCGKLSHIDAEFANHVICPACGREYVMDGYIPLIPYTGHCRRHIPIKAEP